jgi:hypothetical protein
MSLLGLAPRGPDPRIAYYLSYFNGGPSGSLTEEQIAAAIRDTDESPLFVRLTNLAKRSLVQTTWNSPHGSSPTVVFNRNAKRVARVKGKFDVHGFNTVTCRLVVRRVLLIWQLDWTYDWTFIVGQGWHSKKDPVLPRRTEMLCRDFLFPVTK